MTQKDKWSKRPCVQRYWNYKDEVRERGITLQECNFHVTFVIPMPKSWSKADKDLMRNNPHQSKPDVDNLVKGLLDAVFEEDCFVWDLRASKYWGDEGDR